MSLNDDPSSERPAPDPGPPMSVNAPISDTTINRTALLVGAVLAVLVVIVIVVILIAVFSHRPQ
jgi:hypothetical protein